ncbi:hypothetical protein SprV_0501755900 [Sparganum proliferum]
MTGPYYTFKFGPNERSFSPKVFVSLSRARTSKLSLPRCSVRSLFSFFRKKPEAVSGKKEGPSEQKEAHAELLWSEAKEDFVKNELSRVTPSDQGGLTLKKSQIKKIKKAAFLDVVALFVERSGKARRGYNEFILAALDQMKDYEVADDLEAYKALLDVLPRNRLKASTFLHADMGAYKRQQDTVSKLLMQLNAHQVLPDDEVGDKIVEVFGFRSQVMTHYRRMMYWVPKLRHANPWPVLERLPDDLDDYSAYLAHLVAARISPDPNTEFTVIQANPRRDDVKPSSSSTPSCLVSAQSAVQRGLLSAYISSAVAGEGSQSPRVIYLDGPQFVWYRQLQLAYYVLWADLDSERLRKQTELKQKTDAILDLVPEDSWDYRMCGSDRDKPVQLQRTMLRHHALPDTDLTSSSVEKSEGGSSLMELKPNRRSLTASNDRRETILRKRALWSALRSHNQLLTHLPEQLTRHEQAEGTIFALGVVGPVADALEHQRVLFDWEATRGVTAPDDEAGGLPSTTAPDYLPTVPAPAPARLLRSWLKELRVHNPALDAATVVLRADSSVAVETSVVEDEEEEEEEMQARQEKPPDPKETVKHSSKREAHTRS